MSETRTCTVIAEDDADEAYPVYNWVCSECNGWFFDNYDLEYKYCPHCGAKITLAIMKTTQWDRTNDRR